MDLRDLAGHSMSHPPSSVSSAQEVRHQALRLADRQPRHPRTVLPEEELVRTRGAGRSGVRGPGKASAMTFSIIGARLSALVRYEDVPCDREVAA